MHIVFVGAGKIGSAIGNILIAKGEHHVELWDVDPQKVPGQRALPDLLPTADVVFFCIPSWVLESGIIETKSYIQPRTQILSVAKGIEATTKRTVDEMLHDAFPHNAVGLMYGPMLADELARGKPGMAVLASNDASARALIAIFENTALIVESSDDIHGVALAGVLKNVYALGLGMFSSFDFGENAGGWYIATALRELAAIIEVLGGNRETAYGPAGLADFVATAFSSHSRNRQVGEEFVQTGEFKSKSEGLLAVQPLMELLGKSSERFPLLTGVSKIIAKEAGPETVYRALMKSTV